MPSNATMEYPGADTLEGDLPSGSDPTPQDAGLFNSDVTQQAAAVPLDQGQTQQALPKENDPIPTWPEVEASDYYRNATLPQRVNALNKWANDVRGDISTLPDASPEHFKQIDDLINSKLNSWMVPSTSGVVESAATETDAGQIRQSFLDGKIDKETALRELSSLNNKTKDNWLDEVGRVSYPMAKAGADFLGGAVTAGVLAAPTAAALGPLSAIAIPAEFIAGMDLTHKGLQKAEDYLAGKSETISAGLEDISNHPTEQVIGETIAGAAMAIPSAAGYLATAATEGLAPVAKQAVKSAIGMIGGQQLYTEATEQRLITPQEAVGTGMAGLTYGGIMPSESKPQEVAQLRKQQPLDKQGNATAIDTPSETQDKSESPGRKLKEYPPGSETNPTQDQSSYQNPNEFSQESSVESSPDIAGEKPQEATSTLESSANPEPVTDEQLAEIDKSFAFHGTPTGLPPDVPSRGKDFPPELMEASRRLGALVRSKLKLRKGVLGQWMVTKQGDRRIESRSVNSQSVVAHEIGHDIDFNVFPNNPMMESQRSLGDRIGVADYKPLFSELKAVSELMRGPMTGATKYYESYRKRATELIADWFSLYSHDPERARSMAPEWTKGFEAELARHPDVKETVDQLLEGNVKPIPGESNTGAVGKTVQTKNKLQAKVKTDIARDQELRTASETIIKGSERQNEAEGQVAGIFSRKLNTLVKDQDRRNDVGAFVEGGGNIGIKGDTIDAVKSRMTPAMEKMAKLYRHAIEKVREDINKYLEDYSDGEYLKFLEDYLGHFYDGSKAKIGAALGKWSKSSPHAKQRKIPTLQEAVEMGLNPLTQDPSKIYELSSRINWRVATNIKAISELTKLKDMDGNPAIVPTGEAPPGYTISHHPLIKKVYAKQVKNGIMMWEGGAAIHPDIWRAARQILDDPTSSDLGKIYDAINGITRTWAFSGSLFHDVTLRQASVGANFKLTNPLRGLIMIGEKNPITGEREFIRSTRSVGNELRNNEEFMRSASLAGVKFGGAGSDLYERQGVASLEGITAKLRGIPVLGSVSEGVKRLVDRRNEFLWASTHDAYKAITFHDTLAKVLSDLPKDMTTEQASEIVGKYVNDVFGKQETVTKFWLSPYTKKMLARVQLAPDWTTSTIRTIPIGHGELGNKLRAKYWAAEATSLAVGYIATQYLIHQMFGDESKGDKPWVWDNETGNKWLIDATPIMRKMPWADPNDLTRHYINPGKRILELIRWFTDPFENLTSKAARPINELVTQFSGQEGDFEAPWKREGKTTWEGAGDRVLHVSEAFLPFTLKSSQFALSIPMRKGMTKYKGAKALESIYELYASPNNFKSFLRGHLFDQGSVTDLSKQIEDAMVLNGVNPKPVIAEAVSKVRGYHYSKYFKALNAKDEKTMEKESDALSKLGATRKGLMESIKKRSGQ